VSPRAAIQLHVETLVLDVNERLLELALELGAFVADRDESDAQFARDRIAEMDRELSRRLKEFKQMIVIG
jgi:hypothetical protein